MAPSTDENLRPDHIGWPLWQAAFLWKEAYIAAMQEAGHNWYGKAQSNITAFLDPKGTRQRDLVERSGLTKQAVQQLVDDLEAAGIVYRAPDPRDKRAKIIHYTKAGKTALRDGARIKRQIEARMTEGLGKQGMAQLRALLEQVIESGFPEKDDAGR
ncbi:winged helix-turn-helix transcriptional regulator [Pelagibius litoralis]|uniref:Winged helix-turn-helix transcriptional regulator n=1 Tax=Pelagibius litoralis TaxID=374515 RepID=A0A967F2K4_9PROT|nr:MarR family winged helix-turn-helix transcriptional regulator [Pelagibius litoralis]NIA71930.1 winged helix-turn-helix transcriptional regulator [Pelagibius litoralis]